MKEIYLENKIRYHIFIPDFQENASCNYNYFSEHKLSGNAELQLGKGSI